MNCKILIALYGHPDTNQAPLPVDNETREIGVFNASTRRREKPSTMPLRKQGKANRTHPTRLRPGTMRPCGRGGSRGRASHKRGGQGCKNMDGNSTVISERS